VGQYAADYYDLTGYVKDSAVALAFTGDPDVELLEASPSGAATVWWSGRGDNTDSRLTLGLDLTGIRDPRLAFSLWYELEQNWDWGHASVSADNGATWHPVPMTGATEDDPNGTSFAEGVTGSSGGWIEDSLSLAEYSGGEVLVRFETVTDDTVSLTGMALDNVRVTDGDAVLGPASGDWIAEGWAQVPTRQPQRWSVQLVITDPRGASVVPVPVDADGSAQVRADAVAADALVTVVVVAMTPGTRRSAGYRLLPASAAEP
jgi:hypothetical protein